MTERAAFLMKDIVLLTASFYLLKQDVARVARASEVSTERQKAVLKASYDNPTFRSFDSA